jgi:hypothetical protein
MRLSARFRAILRLTVLTLVLVPLFDPSAWALRASDAYWKKPSDRHLHYWIDADSFASPEKVAIVRANLEKATLDWERICQECGIQFIEVANRKDALFSVIEVNVRGAYIAYGFNPADPRNAWALRIDRSYFNEKSKLDKVGVLRHELGHILGYRHEQIAAPPQRAIACNWKTESNLDKVINLTEYDPDSVMQYPCGAPAGPVRYDFSPMDIAGHRKLYGVVPPISPAR